MFDYALVARALKLTIGGNFNLAIGPEIRAIMVE